MPHPLLIAAGVAMVVGTGFLVVNEYLQYTSEEEWLQRYAEMNQDDQDTEKERSKDAQDEDAKKGDHDRFRYPLSPSCYQKFTHDPFGDQYPVRHAVPRQLEVHDSISTTLRKRVTGGVERTKSDEGTPFSLLDLGREGETPARSVPSPTLEQTFEPTCSFPRSLKPWSQMHAPSANSGPSTCDLQSSCELTETLNTLTPSAPENIPLPTSTRNSSPQTSPQSSGMFSPGSKNSTSQLPSVPDIVALAVSEHNSSQQTGPNSPTAFPAMATTSSPVSSNLRGENVRSPTSDVASAWSDIGSCSSPSVSDNSDRFELI